MKWWKNWKAKHWDEAKIEGDLHAPVPHISHW